MLYIQDQCSLEDMNAIQTKLTEAEQEIAKLNDSNLEPITEMPQQVRDMAEKRMEVK